MSSKQAQSAQPNRIQSANRGTSSWADWASEVRNSQPEYRALNSNRRHASAGLTTRIGRLILQDGTDQSGLLRQQRIWSGRVMRLIMTGTQLVMQVP